MVMYKLDLKKEHVNYFNDDVYGDFYDFFANFLRFKQLTGQISSKQKLILYLNWQVKTGDYSYKLVFDQGLNFLANYSQAKNIKIDELRQQFAFQTPHDQIKNFNVALAKIFDQYQIDKSKIAYQLV